MNNMNAQKIRDGLKCSGMANSSCSIMVNNRGFTSGVSRVWQVGHVPCAPLEGGATERFLRRNVPIWERPKTDSLNNVLEVILKKTM